MPQRGRVAHRAALEGVEDLRPVHPDEEMAGKIQALDMRAEPPPRRHIEDAERNRQALAPVDHAQEVGVLHIVIGRPVARIAERASQRGGKAACTPGRCRELVEMRAVAAQRHPRPVERAEQQGRLADVERRAAALADPAEFGFGRGHAARPALLRPSPSLQASGITIGNCRGTTATTSNRTGQSR